MCIKILDILIFYWPIQLYARIYRPYHVWYHIVWLYLSIKHSFLILAHTKTTTWISFIDNILLIFFYFATHTKSFTNTFKCMIRRVSNCIKFSRQTCNEIKVFITYVLMKFCVQTKVEPVIYVIRMKYLYHFYLLNTILMTKCRVLYFIFIIINTLKMFCMYVIYVIRYKIVMVLILNDIMIHVSQGSVNY